jgi:O-antigen ligase/tetratricopeptide (TPR) repeat protein
MPDPVAAPLPATADQPRAGSLAVGAALVAAAVGLWWAWSVVAPWIASGRFPGADAWTSRWPLAVASATALGLVVGLVRLAPLVALAGGLLCGALLALLAAELPHAASNAKLGDGPFLAPVLVALIAALALYVPAGPRSHPAATRVALAAVVVCTANTFLFARQSVAPLALVTLLALLALAATPRTSAASAIWGGGRLGRATLWVGAALVLWILAAALLGDSLVIGLRHWHAVLAGALLAHALAAACDAAAARRVVGALAALVGSVLVCALLAELDLAGDEGWRRTLATRFRLFALHPNQIGPYFAGGAVLCAALCVARRTESLLVSLLRRALLLVLVGGCVWFLVRTGSRASQLGLAVGLAALVVCLFAPLARSPRRLAAAIVVLALAATALWFTPLCDGLREWLEARTMVARSAIGQRYHIWRMAGELVATEPFFGGGPGQNYLHARFAAPSFFDGAKQTLHAHNLPLSLAEGSGLPSLLLFLAFLGLVCETYRRALVGLAWHTRAVVAAPLAASLGMLASNLLDLGQVQPTYLPLHLWITAGLGAAFLRSRRRGDAVPARPGARFAARTLGAVAFVGFGVLPLVADGLIHSGRLLTFTRNEPQAGLARLVLGRRVFPPHPDAFVYDRNAIGRAGGTDEQQLDVLRAVTRREPGNPHAWLELATRLARSKYVDEARAAAEKAVAFDPRGDEVGDAHLVLAVLELRAGDVDGAREELHAALVNQATQWNLVPSREEPVEAAVLPNARRIVYSVRTVDGVVVELPFDEALERLGAEAVELAASEPERARRYLAALHEIYVQQQRPEAAQRWFARYREVVPRPMYSVIKLEWIQLALLGREDEARALIGLVDPTQYEMLETDLASTRLVLRPGVANAIGLPAIEAMLAPIEERDAFTELGIHTARIELAVRVFLAHGEYERAIATARRLLREFDEPGPRRETMELVVRHFVDARVPPPVLLELLDATIVEQNVEARRDRARQSLVVGLASNLHATWLPGDGELIDVARRVIDDRGPAAQLLFAEIERLARADGGE